MNMETLLPPAFSQREVPTKAGSSPDQTSALPMKIGAQRADYELD
jgi:hypothetical protein